MPGGDCRHIIPAADFQRDTRPFRRRARRRRALVGSFLDLRRSEDVHHLLAGGEEVVGDDAPVAAPPDGFRAHDRAPVLTTLLSELCQARGEWLRQSVIGIVPEASPPPICVGRGLGEALLAAETAEFCHMLVADSPGRQPLREGFQIELRIGA